MFRSIIYFVIGLILCQVLPSFVAYICLAVLLADLWLSHKLRGIRQATYILCLLLLLMGGFILVYHGEKVQARVTQSK